MLKKAGVISGILLVFTLVAFGQEHRFDVSGNAAGTFTNSATGSGITQSATNGSEIFVTARARLASKQWLAFNYGRARDSQTYQSSFDYHVATHITEYSGAYVFSPFSKGRFQTFVLGGAGVLKFNPQGTWVILPSVIQNVPNRIPVIVGTASQTRIAFLYGVGADYTLPYVSRFALRFQYRGFLYNDPDFKVNSNTSSISFFTGARGHMAEPSVGLVFRF